MFGLAYAEKDGENTDLCMEDSSYFNLTQFDSVHLCMFGLAYAEKNGEDADLCMEAELYCM